MYSRSSCVRVAITCFEARGNTSGQMILAAGGNPAGEVTGEKSVVPQQK